MFASKPLLLFRLRRRTPASVLTFSKERSSLVDGRDDASHEADRTHDDVEVGECHDCAVAEEAEEEEGEEGADTDYEMDCDHSHRTILTSVFTALFVI